MANRTQIVCLHEGEKGRSIDPIFINKLIRTLNPVWIRPFGGSNVIRAVDCGGRTQLIKKMPSELRSCLNRGGSTTLMVWADIDDDMDDGEALKEAFWKEAKSKGITQEHFDQAVLVFAKDRLENWIEFLNTGKTDETKEGPRVKRDKEVADAARKLAARCLKEKAQPPLPPSLVWSCKNWKSLVDRMK